MNQSLYAHMNNKRKMKKKKKKAVGHVEVLGKAGLDLTLQHQCWSVGLPWLKEASDPLCAPGPLCVLLAPAVLSL
jgi:hypothetical protein